MKCPNCGSETNEPITYEKDARVPVVSDDVMAHHRKALDRLRERVALETLGERMDIHTMSPEAFMDAILKARNSGHEAKAVVMCKHDADLMGFEGGEEYQGVKIYISPHLTADSYIVPLGIYNQTIES